MSCLSWWPCIYCKCPLRSTLWTRRSPPHNPSSDASLQVREPNYLVLLPSTYCTLRIRVRRHNYLADALGPSASEMLIPMITAFRAAPPSPTITLIAQSHVHSRSGQLIIGCFYLADQHMIIFTPSVQLYTRLTLICWGFSFVFYRDFFWIGMGWGTQTLMCN